MPLIADWTPLNELSGFGLILNPQDQLRPGMFANVELKIDGGEGHSVPLDAVLPTGARSLVFVDKGFAKLEPRFIRVGRSFTQSDADGEATNHEVLEDLFGRRVIEHRYEFINMKRLTLG